MCSLARAFVFAKNILFWFIIAATLLTLRVLLHQERKIRLLNLTCYCCLMSTVDEYYSTERLALPPPLGGCASRDDIQKPNRKVVKWKEVHVHRKMHAETETESSSVISITRFLETGSGSYRMITITWALLFLVLQRFEPTIVHPRPNVLSALPAIWGRF